jgi:hypothetical protein
VEANRLQQKCCKRLWIVNGSVHPCLASRFLHVLEFSLLLVELLLELCQSFHLPRLVAVVGLILVSAYA